MYCNKCGNKLKDNAKFCNKCGVRIKEKEEKIVKIIEEQEIKLDSKANNLITLIIVFITLIISIGFIIALNIL